MSELRFDDRVAIVTGAGGGLGRSHALTLAARGAKVVVNDLGGSAHGAGKSASAADNVVEEIRAMGGEAVANYDSVENGEAIVKSALDAFGTLDIVINNAGILRDVSFQKMTQDDWDLVMRVHLNGSKSVSHAAWQVMRDKGFGRIVMTTSAAGIYGNFGQANYCAAKLGILGLANCLAEEGRSKNVLVNTIAPLAASRLTETILPPQLLDLLQPEAVSPLVAWLCHEDCRETKGLFEVGAGYIAKLRWERTVGYFFPNKRPFNVDDVAKKWDKITDFSESTHPTTTTESITPIISGVSNPSLGGNEFIDLDLAAKTVLELESSYDERDLSLYALGIGAARDPLDRNELKYVYELGGSFAALPTFGVMPQMNAMLSAAKKGGLKLPGMNFGFERLLHGEQYTEVKRPLPPHAKLKHTFKLKHAYDKAPNAVVTFAISSKDESGNELIYNEMTAFVKGAGGWGGDRGPSGEENLPPNREPDAIIEEKTDANQTLLYRLSGDWNPLHADPDFAKAFGYDRPILHGLCTYGYCGRHVVKAFCNNDPRFFKSIKARFAKSVFPGDTLVTRMWKESDSRIVFETLVKERNEVVIKNAAVELYKELPQEKPAPAKSGGASAAKPAAASVDMSKPIVADVFGAIGKYLTQSPGLGDKVATVFQFKFTEPESSWVLDLKSGNGSVNQGATDKPDVTLELSEANFIAMCTGAEDAQKLYFGGKLKISGNIMASNKLSFLQKMDPQLVIEEIKARAGGAGSAATPTAAGESAQPVAADVFAAIGKHLEKAAGLGDKVATVFQFKFTEPESAWVIDLKSGNGAVSAGTTEKPDVTLELSEANFIAMCTGAEDAQKLYFGGKLKISGNIMASNKLSFLQKMDPQLVADEIKRRVAGGGAKVSSHTAVPLVAKKEPLAPAVMAALQAKLEKGEIKHSSGKVIALKLRDLNRSWTLDFTVTPARIAENVAAEGATSAAATTLILDDADLEALAKGKADVRDLYQHGKLRVDGEVMPAHQLAFLKGLI